MDEPQTLEDSTGKSLAEWMDFYRDKHGRVFIDTQILHAMIKRIDDMRAVIVEYAYQNQDDMPF